MNDIKELSFEEQLLFKDNKVDGRKQPQLGGFVIVKDADSGKILLAKKNLVIRRGREMTLRQIFRIPGSITDETESTLKDKSILLFGIGSGGAPNNDPFNPFAPTPSDTDLNSAMSFRITTAAAPMPTSDVSLYTDGRASTGGATEWFKKAFSNGHGEITINPTTDETFVKLQLQITKDDARDHFVNELALYWARFNSSATDMNAKYTEYTMFSRITFLTEPLPSNTSKALDIDYYVYL
jgi:hypothetical protein